MDGNLHRLNPQREPELKRHDPWIEEEAKWGLVEDSGVVPVRVVTRFQAIAPWVGLALLMVSAWLVGYLFLEANREGDRAQIPSINQSKPQAPVPLSSELWVVLDALSTAETAEEMVTLIRNPKEMLSKMQFYYADGYSKLPHRFERARPGLNVFKQDGKTFARFEGRCDGRPVKFSFEWTGYGWRLDWESLVGYSDMSWREYLAAKPEGDFQFRLLAKVASGEGLEFDRRRYVCLQLADHLQTGRAYALVERAGAAGRQLEKFLRLHSSGAAPRTWITPVVHWIDGSEDLLELVELKSATWLIP